MKETKALGGIALIGIVCFFVGRASVDQQPNVDAEANLYNNVQTNPSPRRVTTGSTGSSSQNRNGTTGVSSASVGDGSSDSRPFISPSGQITTATAEMMELTPEERESVENFLGSAWEESAKLVADRAKLDKNRSDPENNEYFFKVPAEGDRGAARLDNLKQGLVEILGGERGKTLYEGFSPESTLGGFGSYDTAIKFKLPEDEQQGQQRAWVDVYDADPETGKPKGSRGMLFSEFETLYGKVFEFGITELKDN